MYKIRPGKDLKFGTRDDTVRSFGTHKYGFTTVGLYALLRFVVEIFRGDYARKFVVGLETPRLAERLHLPPGEPVLLSVGQLVSLLVMLAVGGALVRRWRQQRVTAGT